MIIKKNPYYFKGATAPPSDLHNEGITERRWVLLAFDIPIVSGF